MTRNTKNFLNIFRGKRLRFNPTGFTSTSEDDDMTIKSAWHSRKLATACLPFTLVAFALPGPVMADKAFTLPGSDCEPVYSAPGYARDADGSVSNFNKKNYLRVLCSAPRPQTGWVSGSVHIIDRNPEVDMNVECSLIVQKKNNKYRSATAMESNSSFTTPLPLTWSFGTRMNSGDVVFYDCFLPPMTDNFQASRISSYEMRYEDY